MPKKKFNLNALGGGALAEKVGIEMEKIASNIQDPNTKAKAARELTIKIKFVPTEERDLTLAEIDVTSKLQKAQPTPIKFMTGIGKDGAEIAELVSGAKGQMMIDKDGDVADDQGRKVPPTGADNVTQFPGNQQQKVFN